MTSQTLPLNLIPKGVCPRLYVSQYDKGQEWNFDIYAGTEAYTIPSGSTVTIQGTKPDKTGFQYACSFSGNRVTATEQQQMTIIAGDVPAEIRIEKNNEIIATLNFIIAVEKAALADDTVISETELPLIEEAIEVLGHADELVNQIQGYATTAQNAASTATTKASQASTSATNASNSATTASNAATTATNKASEATTAASTATTKASQASTSATSAAGSASTATTKAQEAAASAAAAAQSAAHLTIDGEMSTTSENALQNKVVTSAIQNLSTVISKNGAKNLLPFSMSGIKANNPSDASKTWDGNKYTYNSVEFTPVLDSNGNLLYININTTENTHANAYFFIYGSNAQSQPNIFKGMNLSGCPSGGSSSSYSIEWQSYETQIVYPQHLYGADFGAGTTISEEAYTRMYISVRANVVLDNVRFYPMIRLASDTDPTYEPYAKTNQQLTKETTGLITNLNANGCKNLCVIANRAGTTHNSVTWAVADDDAITCDGTVPSGKYSNFPLCTLKLKKGVTYRVAVTREGTQTGTGNPYLTLNQGSSAVLTGGGTYTPTADVTVTVQLNVSPTIQVTTSAKYYVLVCRESDYQLSPEFNLGAKSNRQLTEDVATINGHGYTLLGNGSFISGNTTFPAEQMSNIQCYADAVLRRAAVAFSTVVSSQALTKGNAVGICNCYNGYIAKVPAFRSIGYAVKDGTYYLFMLTKNTTNNVVAIIPLEDIPSGATFVGTLEWYY